MEQPEFRERFFNPNSWLPMNVKHDDIRQAIKQVYDRYHKMNEFYLDEFDTRFHKAFRAMNAIGDFVGHQFNDALINQNGNLEPNPLDDRRPDIIHGAYQEAAKNRDLPKVDGIEQKAAHYRSFLTSHNEAYTNLLFLQYRVIEPGKIQTDLQPIEFTQILCADASEYGWKFEPRGQTSNTTYRAAEDLKDALRSNPLYQKPEAICQNEHEEKHRRQQARFDPVFADENSEYVTEQQTLGAN